MPKHVHHHQYRLYESYQLQYSSYNLKNNIELLHHYQYIISNLVIIVIVIMWRGIHARRICRVCVISGPSRYSNAFVRRGYCESTGIHETEAELEQKSSKEHAITKEYVTRLLDQQENPTANPIACTA